MRPSCAVAIDEPTPAPTRCARIIMLLDELREKLGTRTCSFARPGHGEVPVWRVP
jgi:hypothetical protein